MDLVITVDSALAQLLTGWWAVRRRGNTAAGLRAGAALVARGEFSIVIAGLAAGTGLNPALEPFTAAYVLILAVAGPIVARLTKDGATTTEQPETPTGKSMDFAQG